MRRHKINQILLYVILTVLAAIFVYQALRKVLGHSWQVESLVLVLIASTLAVVMSDRAKLSQLNGEFRQFKRSFNALCHDFKGMRQEFHDFRAKQENFNNWTRVQFKDIKQKL
ncbi:hypothetical protein GF345_03365 [Candidatus Woesearchaeota archaeon]|nr:hypothetical protein [Candidatus Woesearchaeota archaeon]